ncbi:MAG: hypothetical protein AB7S65_08105 [Sulfuricurvum sp.]
MKIISINGAVLTLGLLLNGCSFDARFVYDTAQNTDRQKCRDIPNPEEQQSCFNAHSKTYDQYQAEKNYH